MRFRILSCLLFLSAATLVAQVNTFDADNQGWRASGDPVSTVAAWQATGGNPGGYIRVTDAAQGGTWYFEAGNAYKGNKCDAYDRFLRWDQFTSDTANQQVFGGDPDVVLEGNNLTLVFDNAQNPTLAWTHYDIQLREDAGWRLGNTGGPAPTQAQFRAVLNNVTALRIRGEYRAQADYGGIDNFNLESSFRFDLDADNSTGERDDGYYADTTCTPSARISDLDPVLFSEKRIDSVVIQVLFAQDPVLEALSAGALPPGITVQQPAPGQLTLVNTGNATPADFANALLGIQYTDGSPNPARGVRIVAARAYTECGNMGQRFAYLPIFPSGNAGLDGDTVLCAGGRIMNLASALGGLPDPDGVWSPTLLSGSGLFDPATDLPGTFAYLIPGAGPCPGDTAYVHVAVEQPFALQNDTTACSGDVVLLSIPLHLINWKWGDGSQKTVLEVTTPGAYTLVGQTEHCIFADSVQVGFFTCEECAVYAPNIFSPNDDGANDQWQLFLPCAWTRFRLEVFDRWGNLVFSADDPEQRWDGFWRGKPVAPGVYVWGVEWEGELFGERKVYRKGGGVTVVR